MNHGPENGSELSAAYDRTADAGPASARFEFNTGWTEGALTDASRNLPRWLRLVGWPLKLIVRRASRDVDLSRSRSHGVVDLSVPRSSMEGEASPHQVVVQGPEGFHEPGESLDESSFRSLGTTHPLWLLALLKGVVEASPRHAVRIGTEDLRAFEVKVDLFRASSASPGGLPPCQTERVEDLRQLPLTVALDDEGRIRRVEGSPAFGETGNHSYVVELFDFGAVDAESAG